MKRVTCIALASALAAAGSALAAPTSVGAGAGARPWLRIVDTTPLTVRGANFRAGEQVTVAAAVRPVARAMVRKSRLVRTGTAGGFTAALAIDVEGCATIAVTAAGASGDRATAKIVPGCAAP